MIQLFGSGAQGYITLVLVLVAGTAGLLWLVIHFIIDPLPDAEADDGSGPGGGGGGPGPGGAESDPRLGPPGSEPAWWPEFERQFADYTSAGARGQTRP
jgi:hypothetical protein